jgi:D-alanyl-D-alanine carboxypeptidase
MENAQLRLLKPPRPSSNKALAQVLGSRKIGPVGLENRSPSIGCLNRSARLAEERPRSNSQRRKRYYSKTTVPKVSASSWCVYDKLQNKLVYGHNEQDAREVASLTKIMTCIVCINLISFRNSEQFDDRVKVSTNAGQMTGTSAELRPGDELTIKSLLYGLMLPSGNDAAWALAEYFGQKLFPGTSQPVKRFLAEMNRTASELGMISTTYSNPHGLVYKPNFSTAADVAKLACYAMKNETFREIVNRKEYFAEIKGITGKIRVQKWENTNKLLGKGFEGVKTGVTNNAGPCLCAFYAKREEIVIVLLNSKSMDDRWVEAKKIAEWTMLKYYEF